MIDEILYTWVGAVAALASLAVNGKETTLHRAGLILSHLS
jgi:hypothetical protein